MSMDDILNALKDYDPTIVEEYDDYVYITLLIPEQDLELFNNVIKGSNAVVDYDISERNNVLDIVLVLRKD